VRWGSRVGGRKNRTLQDPRAKGRWGSQWLTPNGDRPANGSPSGHRLTPNGGRRRRRRKDSIIPRRKSHHKAGGHISNVARNGRKLKITTNEGMAKAAV
jgi:hypothetical protein